MRALPLIMLLAATSAGGDELRYHIPAGWVDLADRSVNAGSFPANTVRTARNPKYRIYAVDPDNLGVVMNVIETQHRAEVTNEFLRKPWSRHSMRRAPRATT